MLTARDIMTKEVITIRLDASIDDLVKLFTEYRVHGVPVVNNKDEVVGIVTETDLIEQKRNLHIPTVITLFDAVISLEGEKSFKEEIKRITASRIEDIYQKKVISVTPDKTAQEIAQLMHDKRVHTIPVMEKGDLLGVIGKIDVIRGLSQS